MRKIILVFFYYQLESSYVADEAVVGVVSCGLNPFV